MENFIIVQVDYEYCNYLRKFDERVPHNSDNKRNRPFIGILFNVGNIEYFTPLSSPKEKHKNMKNTIDFIKIDRGNLGVVNFNNMIPVSRECYEKMEFKNKRPKDKESKYYHMIYLQLLWLNRNYLQITKKAKKLYYNYIHNNLPSNIYDRCCNFLLLEEKCLEYKNIKVLVSNKRF